MYEMNNEIDKEQLQEIRQIRKLIAVPGVQCPSMLRVYGCVFCSIFLQSVYMCVRMPLSLISIAGVPSSQALPGYLITAHHLCTFLMYLARQLCGGKTFFKKKAKDICSAEFEKPTSVPLIAPVDTITPVPLLYHIRTFYIVRYNSPTTLIHVAFITS